MRISDWSSDVCSSDLDDEGLVRLVFRDRLLQVQQRPQRDERQQPVAQAQDGRAVDPLDHVLGMTSGTDQFHDADLRYGEALAAALDDQGGHDRSEEHTSELQSLMRISYAVFCLKKKNKNNTITTQK